MIGLSASMSGVALIPLMMGTVISATIAGRSLVRLDNLQDNAARRHGRRPAGLRHSRMASRAAFRFAALEALLLVITIGLGDCCRRPRSIQNAVPRTELGAATAMAISSGRSAADLAAPPFPAR